MNLIARGKLKDNITLRIRTHKNNKKSPRDINYRVNKRKYSKQSIFKQLLKSNWVFGKLYSRTNNFFKN